MFSPVIRNSQNQSGSPANSQTSNTATGARAVKPVNPNTAMWHSLALPGWGQLDNGRRWKAALMITAELVCIGGIAYESHRLSENGLTEFGREAIRTDRNTFILYLMLAKVVSMMDAYVDAHLADFNVSDIAPAGIEPSGNTR